MFRRICMVNAIVLAGDRKESKVKDVENKALLKINGKFMVEYVIDSLNKAANVDRIVVVGPERMLSEAVGSKVDAVLESGDSIMKNTMLGIRHFNEEKDIIVCTSDIPMVSGEAIEDFVDKCVHDGIDIGYPIIEKSLNDAKYPDATRTYVKMKDGTFTGGNIMYINPAALEKCYATAEGLVEERKNALKMARLLGIIILFKMFLGILRIRDVEKRVNRLFKINARAIQTSYPEIGNDVDKMSDVDFMNKYMNMGL
jgi:GTP:adenosylcobinamide-phosphate guanylyltransferase